MGPFFQTALRLAEERKREQSERRPTIHLVAAIGQRVEERKKAVLYGGNYGAWWEFHGRPNRSHHSTWLHDEIVATASLYLAVAALVGRIVHSVADSPCVDDTRC